MENGLLITIEGIKSGEMNIKAVETAEKIGEYLIQNEQENMETDYDYTPKDARIRGLDFLSRYFKNLSETVKYSTE